MSTASQTGIRHIPGLDGLRGIAVVVVVVFHLGHLPGGYLGVDLFFVLSGFLITSLLLTEGAGTGRIGLGRFWVRRARRLLPALGVALVGVAAYARFVASPEALHKIRWDSLATLLYVANWREVIAGVDYWALFTDPSPLNHTWSLAIEEQFYLIWPLVFVAMVAWSKWHLRSTGAHNGLQLVLSQRVLVFSVLLGVASLFAAGFFGRTDGWERVYFGTDTRAFAILAGAAVAAWMARFGPAHTRTSRGLLEGCALIAMVGLGVAWWGLAGDSWLVRHGGLAACSVAGAVVIAAVAHPEAKILAKVFSLRPLIWMGLISYGVYLYHWPVIVWLSTDRTGLSGWILAAVQIAVTLAVSIASYFFVEQPVRYGTRWKRPRMLWAPAVGFTAVGGLLVVATLGAPSTQNVVTDDEVEAAIRTAASREGPKVMMIGDSLAYYLAKDGFGHLNESRGVTVLNLGRIGCSEPPTEMFREVGGATNAEFNYPCNRGGWFDKAREFEPDYVIWAHNGIGPSEFWHEGRWLNVCSSDFHAWSLGRFESMADSFADTGTKLVVLTSVPSTRGLTSADLYRRYLRTAGCGNRILRDLADEKPDEVTMIDLEREFCATPATCKMFLPDGTELRPDGTHFRGEGAQYVARQIVEHLDVPQESTG